MQRSPNAHNDTYCGTAHRMFFANKMEGLELDKCPDNDGHNVDTADSLVTTVPVALLAADDSEARAQACRLTNRRTCDLNHMRVFVGKYAQENLIKVDFFLDGWVMESN